MCLKMNLNVIFIVKLQILLCFKINGENYCKFFDKINFLFNKTGLNQETPSEKRIFMQCDTDYCLLCQKIFQRH